MALASDAGPHAHEPALADDIRRPSPRGSRQVGRPGASLCGSERAGRGQQLSPTLVGETVEVAQCARTREDTQPSISDCSQATARLDNLIGTGNWSCEMSL